MIEVLILISPIFQYIQHFEGSAIPSGAGDANYFELHLDALLAHFNRLMEAYQAREEAE